MPCKTLPSSINTVLPSFLWIVAFNTLKSDIKSKKKKKLQ